MSKLLNSNKQINNKNYVWHSTEESRDNQTISILAIVETIFFVALTWFVAYHYNTYTHIYTAIAIAPFLLLKTPESADKAIELFLHKYDFKDKLYKDKVFWLILILSAFLSGIISYLYPTNILIHHSIWKVFLLCIFLVCVEVIAVIAAVAGAKPGGELGAVILVAAGVSVAIMEAIETVKVLGAASIAVLVLIMAVDVVVIAAIIVVGETKAGVVARKVSVVIAETESGGVLRGVLEGVLIGVGTAIGLFLRSLILKFLITFIYTLKHPLKTFFNISKNYEKQIAINDICYTPELLPQIHKKEPVFQLSYFLKYKNQNLFELVFKLFTISIWSLGYLYRWSIKSTAWFFFPLAYLANLDVLQDKEKKSKAIKTQTWSGLWWFNLITASMLLIYFKFDSKYLELIGLSDIQIEFITKLLSKLQNYFIPQAMWLLVVAVVLYFLLTAIISYKNHLEEKNFNTLTFWFIRFIYSLWMIAIGWHIVVLTNRCVIPELSKLFMRFGI